MGTSVIKNWGENIFQRYGQKLLFYSVVFLRTDLSLASLFLL